MSRVWTPLEDALWRWSQYICLFIVLTSPVFAMLVFPVFFPSQDANSLPWTISKIVSPTVPIVFVVSLMVFAVMRVRRREWFKSQQPVASTIDGGLG